MTDGRRDPDTEATCPPCPKCGNIDDNERCHHAGTFAAPECDYWHCPNCEHQWATLRCSSGT